jgi:hypothetical protein
MTTQVKVKQELQMAIGKKIDRFTACSKYQDVPVL